MMRLKRCALLLAGLCLALAIPILNPAAVDPQNVAGRSGDTVAADVATDIQRRTEEFLRKLYAWGADYQVTAGPVKFSPMPELYEVGVQVSFQGQSEATVVYVSRDGRYMFRGEVNDMDADPFAAIRQKLTLEGYPSKGPLDAPVVIVEFGDFQCPSCRQLDSILRQMLPTHPQVRLVFKDYPLEQIHPWAMTAALAGRCAFAQSPEAFWKLHDLIYDSQDTITAGNAYARLGQLAAEVGLTPPSFQACLADPQTTESVRRSIAEGRSLGVNSTPTTFINGRRVVGPNQAQIEQYLSWPSSPDNK